MSYATHSSLLTRSGAVVFSTAIHAALGLALLLNLHAGTPDAGASGGEAGRVLVVELLPLPDGGSQGHGDELRKPADHAKESVIEGAGAGPSAHPAENAPRLGTPPRGDEGDSRSAGLDGLEAKEDGAPALSGAEMQAFRALLLRHIERYRQYPPEARAANREGVVRIQFVMDHKGDVIEAWVELSSGSVVLDDEAIAAVMRARPLPLPPQGWPQTFGVSLPIGFALQ
ncbi:TonB family protein [Sandaracinobacter sp. RS1-74]|uniref:energy transducer TonB n=1 Tax=Sandaracinobacteroides sayramensis TaxID=2913411 RepID=UPI001EDB062D|nr:energy transducer TonB [Sandaracinobacteroides sayramensis]MCG2840440.1 TonB family protein [Sandaracinobacteroides sayramensis]